MYEHVVVYCIAASQARRSTAQHSTAQHNQPAQSRTTTKCRSECETARKQTEMARASAYRRAYIQCTDFPKRTKNPNSTRPTKLHDYSHSADVMREGFAFRFHLKKIQHCSFPPSFRMYFVHACSIQVVILEHGALGICKSTVCT